MYSKGIMWVADCRIPFVDEGENKLVFDRSGKGGYRKELVGCEIKEQYKWDKPQGRFTPNLLVCDDMLNDGSVSKSVKSKRGGLVDSNSGTYSWNIGNTKKIENYMCGVDDKGSKSRYYDLDLWFDKMLEKL